MHAYLAQQAFDRAAKSHPDKIAVYHQEQSISYGDLYSSANRLANALKRGGVQRADRVSFILPKSINAIRSILAILKADAIYVPIDPKTPLDRAKEILDDCAPSFIICDKSTMATVQSLLGIVSHRPKVAVLDAQDDGEDASEPEYLNIDEDIAYILYTSGSTGKPKGVMISHLNVFNYIAWAVDYFQIGSRDNVLSTSPLHFDMSIFDVFCPLQTGASLTLVPEQLLIFPIRLVELIEKRGITIWKGVSSLLSYIVNVGGPYPDKMKSLEKVIFSGENLPTKYLIEWMRKCPEKKFFNAYGPTECTGISTCYRIEDVPSDPQVPIPIGKACANTEIFALHEDGSLAKPGEAAELFIRGSSLSRGYWNDAERTKEYFIQNPLSSSGTDIIYKTGDLVKQMPDGNYVFIGRKDTQIKYQGYRIELGEIEHALQSLPRVKDAAVIAAQGAAEDNPEIVAFIESDGEPDVEGILEELKKRVPKYMLPTKFQALKKLPRTENGKVDRQKLMKTFANPR